MPSSLSLRLNTLTGINGPISRETEPRQDAISQCICSKRGWLTANTSRWAVAMMTSCSALLMGGDLQTEPSLSCGQTEIERCDGRTSESLPLDTHRWGRPVPAYLYQAPAAVSLSVSFQLGVNVTVNERGARTKLPSCLGAMPSANAISSIASKSWLAEISTSNPANLLPIQKWRPRANVL